MGWRPSPGGLAWLTSDLDHTTIDIDPIITLVIVVLAIPVAFYLLARAKRGARETIHP
jgi:hypothetical protein